MSTQNHTQNIFNSRELDDEAFTSNESELSDSLDSSPLSSGTNSNTPSEDESHNVFQSPQSSKKVTIVKDILIEINKQDSQLVNILHHWISPPQPPKSKKKQL